MATGFWQALSDGGKTILAELTGGSVAPSQPTESVNPNLGNGSSDPTPAGSAGPVTQAGLAAIALPVVIVLAVVVAGYFIIKAIWK